MEYYAQGLYTWTVTFDDGTTAEVVSREYPAGTYPKTVTSMVRGEPYPPPEEPTAARRT